MYRKFRENSVKIIICVCIIFFSSNFSTQSYTTSYMERKTISRCSLSLHQDILCNEYLVNTIL